MPLSRPERRLRTRYRVGLPLVLKTPNQQTEGTTRNLSLLGTSAYTKDPLPQAQEVHCILELSPGSKPVVANGTVIHSEALAQSLPEGTHEVGVFFQEFEGTGESTLAKFLEQISYKEEAALKAGYKALKQKLAARRRRKQLEALEKRRRRLKRLRRRRLRLARQRRLAAQRRRRKARKNRSPQHPEKPHQEPS